MAKKILFLLNQAPYGSSYALEALESVLVAAVFEQRVSVLFKGAGLHQLRKGQNGAALGQRTLEKVLGALPEYGVEGLFACRPSAERLGLLEEDLCLPVIWLDHDQQRRLINEQEVITG